MCTGRGRDDIIAHNGNHVSINSPTRFGQAKAKEKQQPTALETGVGNGTPNRISSPLLATDKKLRDTRRTYTAPRRNGISRISNAATQTLCTSAAEAERIAQNGFGCSDYISERKGACGSGLCTIRALPADRHFRGNEVKYDDLRPDCYLHRSPAHRKLCGRLK